jgi:hypothetical protein
MLIDLRKILILLVVCSLPTNDVLAQKSKRKASSLKQKVEEIKTIPKAPQEEQIKNIPQENSEIKSSQIPQYWLLSDLKESREDILKYFINEAHQENYFYFKNTQENTTEKIHIDSLLPKCKEFIERFITGYKANYYLEDSSYIKNPVLKNVYKSILNQRDINHADRDSTKLIILFDSINALPISLGKIELLLKCAEISIRTKHSHYHEDVDKFYDAALKNAAQLYNLYEKGKSYVDIGDFASHHNLGDSAIKLYYLAQECFENSSVKIRTKDYEKGLILEKLSDLFNNTGLAPASIVSFRYLLEAEHYFDYAGYIFKRNSCRLKLLDTYAFLLTDLPTEYYAYLSSKDADLGLLNYLKKIYIEQKGNINTSIELKYRVYKVIATILRGNNNIEEALVYYLHAFFSASIREYNQDLESMLYLISFSYSLVGNKNLMKGYQELESFLVEKINDKPGYYYSLLDKADDYYQSGNNDSAIFFLNKIQFDTTVEDHFYPWGYSRLLQKVFNLKYNVFYSLNTNKDSIYYYETEHLKDELYAWTYYSHLLENEFIANTNFLENSKFREMGKQQEQIDSLSKEKRGLKFLNTSLKNEGLHLKNLVDTYSNSLLIKEHAIKKLDSLAKFYALLSKENKKEAEKYKDSAKAAKDSAVRYKDSAQAAKNSAIKFKEEARVAEGARNKANKYLMLFIGFAALTLIAFFLFYRQKIARQVKQSNSLHNENISLEKRIAANEQEAERLAAENKENNYKLRLEKNTAEMKLLSTLASDHNINKFIPKLPNYINGVNPENKEELVAIVTKFKDYYLSTKKMSGSLTNTIKEEIEISRTSSEIYLYMVKSKTLPQIVSNFDADTQIENLRVPKYMITSLVSNSIIHGAIGRKTINVTITAKRQGNNFDFTIDDDGIGFQSLRLEDKPDDEGIKLLINQVKNFNDNNGEYDIEFSPENITNKTFEPGVRVTFKLLKK